MWSCVWSALKSPIARKFYVFVISAVAEEFVRNREHRPFQDDGQGQHWGGGGWQ